MDAFIDGYMYALSDGGKRLYETAYQKAMQEAMANVDSIVEERITRARQENIRPIIELQSKRDEFRRKSKLAISDIERSKYDNYLTAIGWCLNGH